MLEANKKLVKKFYEVLWDAHDKQAVGSVLAGDFTFRGSLGQQKKGHDGFGEYVDSVHLALANYKCEIIELVAEGDKVFAKMSFSGIHRNEFLGFSASLEPVAWFGCALFSFENDLIQDVWVLGDLKSLEGQLTDNAKKIAER
jgi:predicted ester cyclase